VTQIDHFEEIYWPEAREHRTLFMIHELIKGHELTDPHNDESQLYFGFQCLNNVYAIATQHLKAEEIITVKGQEFDIKAGPCLALNTSNDDTIKLAQKQGYVLVLRKDPKLGSIRIKARPDAEFDLEPLYNQIKTLDQTGTWFYHASGKMLLNGSTKDRNQKPSPLSLKQVVEMIQAIYAIFLVRMHYDFAICVGFERVLFFQFFPYLLEIEYFAVKNKRNPTTN